MREQGTAPLSSFAFEAWCEPHEHGKGLWHEVAIDPFNDSYSEITEAIAKRMIGEGDLYGPVEDERYERATEANMARYA